jgi:hypothetical protein
MNKHSAGAIAAVAGRKAVPAKKIQPVERAAPFDLDQHVTPFISTRFRVMTVTK